MDSNDGGVLGERAAWMARGGRDLYFRIMWDVKRRFGRSPLAFSQAHADRFSMTRHLAKSALVMFDRNFTGLSVDARGLAAVITDGAMHAVEPHLQVICDSQLHQLERNVDVAAFKRIADPSFNAAVKRHLRDSIKFGFSVTVTSGALAVASSPLVRLDELPPSGRLAALIDVMNNPNFVPGVLNHLAASGFVTLTNDIFRGVGPDQRQWVSEEHFHVRHKLPIRESEQRIEWVPDPWRPQLATEFRRALRHTMEVDGRTPPLYPRLTRLPDETSSGCPVRHSSVAPTGEVTSGIAVANQICIDALSEVLQQVQAFERDFPTPVRALDG